jgi:ATP-dependent exoDNAse (exonuclease V) alpha subunit
MSLTSYIAEQKSLNERTPIPPTMPSVVLSDEQNNVIDILNCQLLSLEDPSVSPPKSIIIQGRAGSGKSTLIQAMTYTITKILGNEGFKLMAPTGAAAVNVNGATIHSALHIYVEKSERPLGAEALSAFQTEMKECHFIIIDEMSMVGCSLLKKIDGRCREAKPNASTKPFGGMFLYLFGDIKQLPPVLDRPIYGQSFRGTIFDQGQLLWKSIEKVVILKCCHRQDSSQERFRQILDRISEGDIRVDDWKTLLERTKTNIPPTEIQLFQNSLHIYSTNLEAFNYNMSQLSKLDAAVAIIPAQNNCLEAANADHEAAQGLEQKLYFCIGARVMLRSNLWIDQGLVNGSIGTITDIVYAPGKSPPSDPPITVLVKFDHYDGPSLNGSIPIPTITKSWKNKEKTLTRSQFPLSLAWAVTIHKSQGLTLDKVVVSLGDRELALGITYVALSRVRHFEDIMFDPGFNFSRLDNIKKCKLLVQRLNEESRLKKLM